MGESSYFLLLYRVVQVQAFLHVSRVRDIPSSFCWIVQPTCCHMGVNAASSFAFHVRVARLRLSSHVVHRVESRAHLTIRSEVLHSYFVCIWILHFLNHEILFMYELCFWWLYWRGSYWTIRKLRECLFWNRHRVFFDGQATTVHWDRLDLWNDVGLECWVRLIDWITLYIIPILLPIVQSHQTLVVHLTAELVVFPYWFSNRSHST